MAIEDDFSVALNGDIRYGGGGSTYYTVLELHRYLQNLADDASATGNDLVDITSLSPSDRSTNNIITLNSPYNIDDDAAEQLYDGSIEQDGGDTLYSGLVVVGSVVAGTQLQIIRNNTEVTSWWGTGINQDAANNIILRVIIKTREKGVDIDSKKLRVQAREFGDRYAEFSLTAGLGNSTAAIFTEDDLNNDTAQATVASWDCSNTEGYQQIDLNNGNGNRDYYSKWDLGTRTLINDLYEFTKNITRRGTAETIHSMNGKLFRGITHEWDYDTESGNFSEDEVLAWGCSFNYDAEVTITDNGASVDLTGCKITMGVKNNYNAASYSFTLKNTAAGGDDTQIEDSDLTNGIFKIHIIPTNTSSLVPGKYVYDIEIITTADKTNTVISDILNLLPDVA